MSSFSSILNMTHIKFSTSVFGIQYFIDLAWLLLPTEATFLLYALPVWHTRSGSGVRLQRSKYNLEPLYIMILRNNWTSAGTTGRIVSLQKQAINFRKCSHLEETELRRKNHWSEIIFVLTQTATFIRFAYSFYS